MYLRYYSAKRFVLASIPHATAVCLYTQKRKYCQRNAFDFCCRYFREAQEPLILR